MPGADARPWHAARIFGGHGSRARSRTPPVDATGPATMAQVSVRVLRADDRVAVPWRNDGGRTREIAVGGADEEQFDWRVSLADIDRDGPFSGYPGYSRVISVVEGDGVELTVD